MDGRQIEINDEKFTREQKCKRNPTNEFECKCRAVLCLNKMT